MFPVSAAMLKNPPLYDHSLEAFANPLMRLIEYDIDDLGQMTVPGESGRWYRYIDMTAQAEALYDFVRLTIDHELWWKNSIFWQITTRQNRQFRRSWTCPTA